MKKHKSSAFRRGEQLALRLKRKEDPRHLIGKVVVGLYPRHNFRGVPTHFERRQVRVESVRVIKQEPLDELTSIINPFVNRGDILITGVDLDKKAERSFYLESFRVWESFDFIPS